MAWTIPLKSTTKNTNTSKSGIIIVGFPGVPIPFPMTSGASGSAFGNPSSRVSPYWRI